MNDPQQRERQRLIAPPEAIASGGEGPSQIYAPNSIWTLGVVRDVGKWLPATPPAVPVWQSGTPTDPGEVLRWQRGRYARGQVPTYGEYEAYGPVETGYPMETKKGADYTALKVAGSDIPESATFIRATWRGGFWIVEEMSGGGFKFALVPGTRINPPGPNCVTGANTIDVQPVKRSSGTAYTLDGPQISVRLWGAQTGKDFFELITSGVQASSDFIPLVQIDGEWFAMQYLWWYEKTPNPAILKGDCGL
jgi:hypothetical protein